MQHLPDKHVVCQKYFDICIKACDRSSRGNAWKGPDGLKKCKGAKCTGPKPLNQSGAFAPQILVPFLIRLSVSPQDDMRLETSTLSSASVNSVTTLMMTMNCALYIEFIFYRRH